MGIAMVNNVSLQRGKGNDLNDTGSRLAKALLGRPGVNATWRLLNSFFIHVSFDVDVLVSNCYTASC